MAEEHSYGQDSWESTTMRSSILSQDQSHGTKGTERELTLEDSEDLSAWQLWLLQKEKLRRSIPRAKVVPPAKPKFAGLSFEDWLRQKETQQLEQQAADQLAEQLAKEEEAERKARLQAQSQEAFKAWCQKKQHEMLEEMQRMEAACQQEEQAKRERRKKASLAYRRWLHNQPPADGLSLELSRGSLRYMLSQRLSAS